MENCARYNSPSGLEVAPGTGAEPVTINHLPSEKYANGSGVPQRTFSPNGQTTHLDRSCPPDRNPPLKRKTQGVFWILSIIAMIVCGSAALGAGLGAGLAAQRRQSVTTSPDPKQVDNSSTPISTTSNSTSTSSMTTSSPNTSILAFPSSTATEQLDNSSMPVSPTSDSVPASASSTISSTPIQTTLAPCPSADGTIYTATDRPLPSVPGALTNNSLQFEVVCNTNWADYDDNDVMDLQCLAGVTSLQECIELCAKYTWQAPGGYYETQGCTGAVWSKGLSGDSNAVPDSCVLKANVSLSTPNNTLIIPGFDGAVLLFV